MKKIIILISFLSVVIVHAQTLSSDTTQLQVKKHNVGLSAGEVAGTGFAYRYRVNKTGFQVTGSWASGGTVGNKIWYSINGLYTLKEVSRASLYIYGGVSSHPTSSLVGANGLENRTVQKYVSGIGLGIEVVIAKRFALNYQNAIGVEGGTNELDLKGAIGFYYKF